MIKIFELNTEIREGLINITPQILDTVRESGIDEGLCVVSVPHTTAAVTINSAMDENTELDILSEVRRLVPTRVDFHHIYDTPADAAGHIKATLIGNSVTVIITKNQLLLGGSQSILFFEFDGPRKRQFFVRILADTCKEG
jgi:secondary thiamine-phosphate synthase enzyme